MTPLVLIAGFLGAGKTTLLRALLPRLRAAGLRPHVILNDYRNATIDAVSLGGDAGLVTPIAGTCIGCGSQDELMEALQQAPLTAESVMLIEANGTADTTEIIELLTVDRRVARYTRPTQISVVDAGRWQRRGRYDAVERVQVQTAGYLYVNRLDEVGEEHRGLLDSVRSVAPRGVLAAPDDLVRALADLRSASDRLPPRRFHRAQTPKDGPPGNADRHRAVHHFSSVEVPMPEPVEEAGLRELLGSLPEEVVRVKGIARLVGAAYPVYFERTDRAGSAALSPIRSGRIQPAEVVGPAPGWSGSTPRPRSRPEP